MSLFYCCKTSSVNEKAARAPHSQPVVVEKIVEDEPTAVVEEEKPEEPVFEEPEPVMEEPVVEPVEETTEEEPEDDAAAAEDKAMKDGYKCCGVY